jgi:long-chain acyl-CoA synthetase
MNLDPRTNPARSAHGRLAADVHHAFHSWAAVMKDRVERAPDSAWMVYVAEDGSRTTYTTREFVEGAQRLAAVLADDEVSRGSRVAIAGHNHPDTIMAYFACWLLGACAVPLNMTEDDGRLQYILTNSGVTCALVRSEYLLRILPLAPQECAVIEVDSDAEDSQYRAMLADAEPVALPSDDEDMRFDDCLIVYTSGTTGNPKGVVLMQQNLFADGYDIAQWHGIDASTRMMCVLPIHHVNGTIVTHVTPFLAGASVVLHRRFRTERFFSSIRDEGVHVVSVVPTLLAFLLDGNADDLGVREHGFRHIICGAGPLTVELATQFEERYHIPIVHGYGLSETTCYNCFLPTELSWDEHRAWMSAHGFPSIGVPIPCNEMSIHDAQGAPVAEGERGEIVARGANTMKEYDANETANADAFAHGWFRSGDEGFFKRDAQGRSFFFITGRIKELIIRGGVNLAPLEIDEVICRAPGVQAGIAVGFENDMFGEEVGALVVPQPGASMDLILSYCREHLPHAKTPKVVVFTEALPVTSTGKYQRNKVKGLFREWRGTQFKK